MFFIRQQDGEPVLPVAVTVTLDNVGYDDYKESKGCRVKLSHASVISRLLDIMLQHIGRISCR